MTTDPYDLVAYEGGARASTHPGRLLAQARLLGRPTPDPASIRVIEIGCGHGANLIPMALDLPGATFVGIDLAREPIDRARQAARELAVPNVEFLVGDIRSLPDELDAEFDVVIAHGFYSWVPRDARSALLAAIGTRLATSGVAFVSYNTYPGSYARDAIRDIVAYSVDQAVGANDDPAVRITAARRMLDMLSRSGGGTDAHGQAIASYARALLARPDWLLYHDELAPVCQPVYLHEFVDHASQHGLAYLFESHLSHGLLRGVPADVAATLSSATSDVVVREQHVDFLVNRLFRESLLVRGDLGAARPVHVDGSLELFVRGSLERLDGLEFRAHDGTRFEVDSDAAAAALVRIADAFPTDVAVADIANDVDEAGRAVRSMLVNLHIHQHVELSATRTRAIAAAGDRPHVDPLVRWQVRRGRAKVTNALHDDVTIDDQRARDLLVLLDGTRTPAEIATSMALGSPSELDAPLARLAQVSLLTPAPART